MSILAALSLHGDSSDGVRGFFSRYELNTTIGKTGWYSGWYVSVYSSYRASYHLRRHLTLSSCVSPERTLEGGGHHRAETIMCE